MPYLLDANVFITAKNTYYGFDFAPGFWTWIEQAHLAGDLFSIQAVKDELLASDDDLAEWAKQQPDTFYRQVTAEVAERLAEVSGWCASEARYTPGARMDFLAAADFYLVAHAAAGGFTVVTHERPSPESKKRVKIPDACLAVDVPYCSPWQMLKNLNAKFM